MTPAETRAKVDTQIDAVLPTITVKANNFFAANGRYWQALRTHSVPPLDGVDENPDVGIKAPTDQGDGWPIALRNRQYPMAISVDVYDGPQGKGWVVVITSRVTEGAEIVTWVRVVNIGPEIWREQPWAVLPPELAA